MPGTGQGLLQPSKLVQVDDMMPSIALPGYYSVYVGNTQTAGTHTLASIPDGMTAEVVDFGMTVGNQAVVSTSGATESTVTFNVLAGKTAATDIMAAADISAGATTAAIGATLSALRSSTGYSFSAASVALGNKYGAGGVIQVSIADSGGTAGAPGACTLWVRLKWTEKDTGAI